MANRFQELFRLLPEAVFRRRAGYDRSRRASEGLGNEPCSRAAEAAQLRSAPDMRLQGFCPRV